MFTGPPRRGVFFNILGIKELTEMAQFPKAEADVSAPATAMLAG